MIRTITLLLVLGCGQINVMAEEAPSEDLFAPIAACIDDNVVDVERAVPNLQSAADFLVGYLCAGEVADRERKHQQAQMGAMIALTDAYRTQMQTECEESDDIECDLSRLGKFSFAYKVPRLPRHFSTSRYSSTLNVPSDARAYAARVLFDLRSSRLDSEESGE